MVDVAVASDTEAEVVTGAIKRNPIASMTLVGLLRHNERVSTEDALLAESLAYSTLQHGAEFQSWLASRPCRRVHPDPAPCVLVERVNDELHVTLNRPHRRNAYSSGLRDALCEALYLVADDPGVAKVILKGAGVCFSAGGDLDEFGEGADAGLAHASRLTRGAGRRCMPWATAWKPGCTGRALVRVSNCRRSRAVSLRGKTRFSSFPRCPWDSCRVPAER